MQNAAPREPKVFPTIARLLVSFFILIFLLAYTLLDDMALYTIVDFPWNTLSFLLALFVLMILGTYLIKTSFLILAALLAMVYPILSSFSESALFVELPVAATVYNTIFTALLVLVLICLILIFRYRNALEKNSPHYFDNENMGQFFRLNFARVCGILFYGAIIVYGIYCIVTCYSNYRTALEFPTASEYNYQGIVAAIPDTDATYRTDFDRDENGGEYFHCISAKTGVQYFIDYFPQSTEQDYQQYIQDDYREGVKCEFSSGTTPDGIPYEQRIFYEEDASITMIRYYFTGDAIYDVSLFTYLRDKHLIRQAEKLLDTFYFDFSTQD